MKRIEKIHGRKSSFELLIIICMLMIIAHHYAYFEGGG